MINYLDEQIARVLAELNKLKRQKLEALRRQMWELEKGSSSPEVPFRPKPQPRRITDMEAKDLLTKAVEEAGDAGISARKAAAATGISYARASSIMASLFKRTGKGKHTLYFTKKKRGK